MEIFQIEAFVEIARQGSISRAAERLFLTQPTVTNRLQGLEAIVGQPLFTRVPHGVVLTDAGKLLLPYARRALQAITEGELALNHLRDATEGSLFIGSVTNISTYLMPMLLQSFSQKYPGVHLVIRSGHTHEIVERVLMQDVQIGLVYQMTHPDIISTLVYEDKLLLVVHPDHPFCQRATVTAEEIAAEPLVLLKGISGRTLQGILAKAGLKVPAARFEVDNAAVAKKIVESGQAISLLHGISIRRELDLGRLVAIPIPQLAAVSPRIFAIYHKTSGIGGIARAFLGVAQGLDPGLR